MRESVGPLRAGAEASQSPAQQSANARTQASRRWHRLHASTHIAMLLAAAVFVLLCVPGQYVTHLVVNWPQQFPLDFGLGHRIEHGWPAVFLTRDTDNVSFPLRFPFAPSPPAPSLWSLNERVVELSLPVLLLDGSIGLAIVAIVGVVCERRRRLRTRFWQFTVGDLLICTAVLAIGMGRLVRLRHDYQQEQNAIGSLLDDEFVAQRDVGGGYRRASSSYVMWQSDFPSWIAALAHPEWSRWFDRVVFAKIAPARLEHVRHFKRLRFLRLDDHQQYCDLDHVALLDDLRELESTSPAAGFHRTRSRWSGASCQRKSPTETSRWYRLHVSTLIAAALAAGLMFLANFPGNNRTELDLDPGNTTLLPKIEHGWPKTYLRREPIAEDAQSPSGWRDASLWAMWDSEVEALDTTALFLDIAIAVWVILAIAGLLEYRRRRRDRFWQVRLRELLACMAVVSSLLGYLSWNYRTYREEEHILTELAALQKNDRLPPCFVQRSPRGCTWLERLLGERYVPIFDRVSHVQHPPAQGLHLVSHFKALQALELIVPLDAHTTLNLAHLRQLQSLELHLLARPIPSGWRPPNGVDFDEVTRRAAVQIQSAKDLPRLRVLSIVSQIRLSPVLHEVGRIRTLEMLRIDDRDCHDEDIAGLSQLENLRFLILQSGKVTNDSLATIARLKNLRSLVLDCGGIVDDGLARLSPLMQLEELRIKPLSFLGPGIEHLKRLPALRYVVLPDSAHVKAAAKKHLPHVVVRFR